MEVIAAAGLNAGANLLGSLIGSHSQRKANIANERFTMKMWNLNNQYNSPVEQMKRLKQAGLNPNLVYGGGSAAVGQSSQAASVHHQPTVNSNVGSVIGDFLNGLQIYNNLRAQELQNANLEQDNILKKKTGQKLQTDINYNLQRNKLLRSGINPNDVTPGKVIYSDFFSPIVRSGLNRASKYVTPFLRRFKSDFNTIRNFKYNK